MEAQTSEIKISAQRLKHLIRHIALAEKKTMQKERSKAAITESIEKIRETVKHPEVMDELEKIEKKVSELVEMQAKARNANELMLQKLQQKIGFSMPAAEARPFSDFERISTKLSENAVKLNKIGETEEKIEKNVEEEKSGIQEIESRLKILESRFNKLKSSKKAKKSDLERIKSMIERHKKAIKEIKSRQ